MRVASGDALDEARAVDFADFVCITVPLSAETEKLIGAREFGLMKPGAIFINIARGKVDRRQTLTKAEFVDGGTVGPAP